MMKQIISYMRLMALLLILSMADYVNAQGSTSKYDLVLEMKDGSTVEFYLIDKPVIKMSKTELAIVCNGDTVSTTMTEVTNYHFTKAVPTSIAESTAQTEKPLINAGKAYFSGLQTGERITIYTLDGKSKRSVQVSSDGHAIIELTGLGTGVFILHTTRSSYKVSNK